MQTIGLRFFTVYGPWGRPDMAMWLFAKAIAENKPIKVFNNGNMQRDFTYIDDIVQGVIACIDKDNLDLYEVFNLGNHQSEDLMEMIGLIESGMQKKAVKEFLPMQPGDVQATYADIEKAQKKLGFVPYTRMKDGVQKFITWFKSYHGY
jgi:UDP-glucuronate 4-epimerase